jgi:secreted trypsin-like serine protease
MYLAGMVSFGSKSCAVSIPEVYTNVGNFMDWIKTNLKP